jgi:O-acetyl-ADP-ribose deacetylase (regulator of RNase III)
VKLRIVLGALADQQADAVVRIVDPGRRRTADDTGLLAAAGPAAAAAFEELLAIAHPAGLPAGQALSTTAGDLPARWLIHVAVPAYVVRRPAEHVLADAYRTMLGVADELGARSVALTPFGLTQPYWPLERATRVAISTLPHTLTVVREGLLVVRTPAASAVMTEALARR